MNNPNNKSSLNREDIGGSSNILIRITGQDRPGLTASVMQILSKYDTKILDIGQADIHATLSLGILIRVDEENSGRVMKELLFKATELQVNIGFAPITDEEYEEQLINDGKAQLEEKKITAEYSGEILNYNMYEYGKDYYLGDKVSIKNEYGITGNATITEITEVEDASGYRLVPTLSEWQPINFDD